MSTSMGPTMAGSAPGPMTVGRVLDRVWMILRGNFWLFLKLGSLPAVAVFALYALLFAYLRWQHLFPPTTPFPDPSRLFSVMLIATLVGMVPLLLTYAVYAAAASYAAIEANRGRQITFRAAYAMAFRRVARFVWLMIIQTACVAAPSMVMGAAFFGCFQLSAFTAKGPTPGALFLLFPLTIVGYFLGLVFGIWMLLRLGLAFPASVTENLSAVQALRRSAALTRRAKGRMFVVLLAIYGISYGVLLALELIVFALAAVVMLIAAGLHFSTVAGLSGLGVAGAVFAVMIFVWSTMLWGAFVISLSVVYDDQRLRLDGVSALIPGA